MFRKRYVILTGGSCLKLYKASAKSLLLDLEKDRLLDCRSLPDLNQARRFHASCTTDETAIVYGGHDLKDYVQTLEIMRLTDDALKNVIETP